MAYMYTPTLILAFTHLPSIFHSLSWNCSSVVMKMYRNTCSYSLGTLDTQYLYICMVLTYLLVGSELCTRNLITNIKRPTGCSLETELHKTQAHK